MISISVQYEFEGYILKITSSSLMGQCIKAAFINNLKVDYHRETSNER